MATTMPEGVYTKVLAASKAVKSAGDALRKADNLVSSAQAKYLLAATVLATAEAQHKEAMAEYMKYAQI